MRRILTAVSLLVAVHLSAPLAAAQIPPTSSTTSTPVPGAGHDYLGGQVDTVNPASGSISIRIPVIMPPGRALTVPLSFAYDSNGVNYVPSGGLAQYWATTSSMVSTGGWSNSVPVVSVSILRWTTQSQQDVVAGASPQFSGTINCTAYVNYVFQDPFGNRHNLNLTTNGDPNGTSACSINAASWPYGYQGENVYQGNEGPILGNLPSTTLLQAGHVNVTDGEGTVYAFTGTEGYNTFVANSVTDRNGNTLTVGGSAGAYSYVDTAGRTVFQDSGFAISPETVTISGLGAPYQLTWTTLSTPTFSTPITTLSGTCTSPGHNGWANGVQGLSALTLPNGQSFTFTYDPTYGLVNRINYPTGGYVRYVWGMNDNAEWGYSVNSLGSIQCEMMYAVPVITDRYVSFDGSTEVLHQQFIYATMTCPLAPRT